MSAYSSLFNIQGTALKFHRNLTDLGGLQEKRILLLQQFEGVLQRMGVKLQQEAGFILAAHCKE
ncbi:MAG TPA: hypothetical protein DD473_05900 [Planctomycetaceae bacterium]|nr:hypothetical protein [Planctomycetaceae bacterium]|tara:strand:- start:224 stop:415 length:192 start_codon:yes stop_codon:yes gene_type:complete